MASAAAGMETGTDLMHLGGPLIASSRAPVRAND
jgi:hypothetical protein